MIIDHINTYNAFDIWVSYGKQQRSEHVCLCLGIKFENIIPVLLCMMRGLEAKMPQKEREYVDKLNV